MRPLLPQLGMDHNAYLPASLRVERGWLGALSKAPCLPPDIVVHLASLCHNTSSYLTLLSLVLPLLPLLSSSSFSQTYLLPQSLSPVGVLWTFLGAVHSLGRMESTLSTSGSYHCS